MHINGRYFGIIFATCSALYPQKWTVLVLFRKTLFIVYVAGNRVEENYEKQSYV